MKWNVHFGARLTCDIEVEADSYDEAIDKANDIYEDMPWSDMNLGDIDSDAWVMKGDVKE